MKGIKPSRLASGINQYVVVATVESLHHPIKGQFGKLLILETAVDEPSYGAAAASNCGG